MKVPLQTHIKNGRFPQDAIPLSNTFRIVPYFVFENNAKIREFFKLETLKENCWSEVMMAYTYGECYRFFETSK